MKNPPPIQYFLETLEHNRKGIAKGIYSICSANRFVIEACMKKVARTGQTLLIEATCNQVNQFGGYTGMKPADFISYIHQIADQCQFARSRILFGGDHLGPYPWRNLPAETAMQNARQMVKEYVKAGYSKIHLDASMFCADDDRSRQLSKSISAERSAQLCLAAEETCEALTLTVPQYIIGSEVPLPGGQQQDNSEIEVTEVKDVKETLELYHDVFTQHNLHHAWQRIRAIVVQPGVEFGENGIADYQRGKARPLKEYIEKETQIVYEAHSTDFQRRIHLKEMVEDHFAILKVGPALTFSFREAVLALEKIEKELYAGKGGWVCSNLSQTLLSAMDREPAYWKSYYPQDDLLEVNKLFGFSDRIRYYWNDPEVKRALVLLVENLRARPIPLSLLRQFLPNQFNSIREGILAMDVNSIILDHIGDVIEDYQFAGSPES